MKDLFLTMGIIIALVAANGLIVATAVHTYLLYDPSHDIVEMAQGLPFLDCVAGITNVAHCKQ